jgi:hypothetical protein
VSTSPGAKAQAEPCHWNLLTIIRISELAEASLDDIPLVLEYPTRFCYTNIEYQKRYSVNRAFFVVVKAMF